MGTIILYLVIAAFGFGISFLMAACIKRFSNEEKIMDRSFFQDCTYQWKLALITPIAFIALFFFFGLSEKFFVYTFVMTILIMDMFTDLKAQIIPNGLNMVGFIVGIIYMYYKLVTDVKVGVDLVLGLFVGGGIFILIALFALIVYKKEGMGLGDVKLMGVLGLFLGARNIFQVFILSFAIGAFVSILLLITKKKKIDDYVPFGPFIVLATIITMFAPYTVMLNLIEKFLIG